MIDWETDVVILAKVVRKTDVILGKSTVLVKRAVAEFDNGEIRSIAYRRDGKVTSNLFKMTYEQLLEGLLHFEREYMTAVQPEWHRK
ncbi:hypothetical protein ACFWBI_07900 [Streptomyces sp. NPDC059982]|uniref:hypothetical protein n=1 Tax=unclassified Streptomyces TaxID=2593676 RepID=UPI0036C3DB0E